MTSARPPDPERVVGPRSDRRWVVVPLVLVGFLLVALVKPWGGDHSSDRPSAPVAIDEPSAHPSPTRPVRSGLLPAAADVVESIRLQAAPWANELAADSNGAWAWADFGLVVHADPTTHDTTMIDLGPPASEPTPLGARGIAVAGSQVWASDPGHRGLARIDRETGAVAERIALWSEDQAAAVRQTGATFDRWATAWGFAIDGDSIFVPSIAMRPGDVVVPPSAHGELFRVDTSGEQPPGWISIARPTGVAVGFGSVWVVSCCASPGGARTDTIVRLEEETGGIQATITLPDLETEADARPVVRIGPDSVWVGLAELPAVVRIDPATSTIRSLFSMELPVSDLAVGDDGSIWATELEAWFRSGAVLSDRCDGRLVRIDPVIERVVASSTVTCPMSVAVAGEDIWIGSAGTEPSATGGMPPRLLRMRAIELPG